MLSTPLSPNTTSNTTQRRKSRLNKTLPTKSNTPSPSSSSSSSQQHRSPVRGGGISLSPRSPLFQQQQQHQQQHRSYIGSHIPKTLHSVPQSRRPRLNPSLFHPPASSSVHTSFSNSIHHTMADTTAIPCDTEDVLSELNGSRQDVDSEDFADLSMMEPVRIGGNGMNGSREKLRIHATNLGGVENGNNESLLQYLCDMECGLTLLLNRTKQNMITCKETVQFLRKRAQLEEEYGRGMGKLVQATIESSEKSGVKTGTFGETWTSVLKIHDIMGENRVKFSAQISEVADDLVTAYKDTERSRKQLKDAGTKHEKFMQDAEAALEKAKVKYESNSEEWERSILQKNGDILGTGRRTITKSMSIPISLFKQSNGPAKLNKMEEDARYKAAIANETYKQQLSITNATRADYYNVHLPQILKSVKETIDESDSAVQYQLGKYAFCFESTMMADATTLSPLNEEETGLRNVVEKIDNVKDLHGFIAGYGSNAGKVQKSEIPYVEYGLSPTAQSFVRPRNIFGIDLAEQLQRDGNEVPPILTKCIQAVEQYGLKSQGIYRLSGSSTHVQKLRTMFDRNYDAVDLSSEDLHSDINNVTGVLKLYFRELPDPLLTGSGYSDFIEASKLEDDRLRVITMHDHVNSLPDANYATLRLLMCHLDKVQAQQPYNKMGVSNLGIVFGPTLMGSPPAADPLHDMSHQCKVVETILEHYKLIFEPDE